MQLEDLLLLLSEEKSLDVMLDAADEDLLKSFLFIEDESAEWKLPPEAEEDLLVCLKLRLFKRLSGAVGLEGRLDG